MQEACNDDLESFVCYYEVNVRVKRKVLVSERSDLFSIQAYCDLKLAVRNFGVSIERIQL